MKIVVGLGNPGDKYQGTRHNIGFEVLSRLEKKWCAADKRDAFQAQYTVAQRGGDKILLFRPMTFMNLSGQSVLAVRDFYKVAIQDILVVCDDLALALGKIRVRSRGSSGGQKGLADVIRRLGSEEIPRLRVGIGATPPGWETADFVLSRFGKDELPLVDEALEKAAKAVDCWVEQGINVCMNQFNT